MKVKIKGFRYQRNSCFMDTIVFVLLYKKDTILWKVFLEELPTTKRNDPFYRDIYEVLCNLYKYIHDDNAKMDMLTGSSTESLRKILWKYRNHPKIKNGFETFHDCRQHDAIEFLEFMFNIFDFRIPIDMYSTITVHNRFAIQCNHDIVRNLWLPWKLQKRSLFYIYHYWYGEFVKGSDSIEGVIDKGIVSLDDDIEIKRYISGVGNVIFSQQERWEKITELGDFFVFVVHRENPATLRVNRKPIEISLKIGYKRRNLYLDSIIMHSGRDIESGHYTCLQRYGNLWFHYNDMDSNMERQLYTWDKLVREYKPTENGIAFFYFDSK